MTDMTRRGFFRLAAGAAALVAVPNSALGNAPEKIWCDGTHDDGPGLTALLRGDAVQFMHPSLAKFIGWHGDSILKLDGIFTIKTPVRVGHEFSGKALYGGIYKYSGDSVFVFTGCNGILVSGMIFEHELLRRGHPATVSYSNS